MHLRSPFYPTASIIHLAGPLSCRPFPRAVRPSRRARRSSTSSSPRRPTALWYASPAEPRPAPSPFCSRARAARPSRFHCKHGNVRRCFDVARTAPPYRAPSALTLTHAPRSSLLAPRSPLLPQVKALGEKGDDKTKEFLRDVAGKAALAMIAARAPTRRRRSSRPSRRRSTRVTSASPPASSPRWRARRRPLHGGGGQLAALRARLVPLLND